MYLGVDLGTTSLKVLLCDSKGTILDTTKVDYKCYYPHSGWSEQNPIDWLNAFKSTLATLKLKHDTTQIRSISFCGQMHGLVVLDKDDNVIRPAILWNDSRSTVETQYINDKFGDKLLDMVGNIAFVGFTAPKLLWLRGNEPDNFAKVAKIMLPKDYLLYMCSGVFASDVSDNSGTLYFDVRKKCWQREIIALLGIDENKLPKIFESYQCIGNISAEFAKESGLSLDTKIVAGGGDNAVGAIGTGTIGDGRCNLSLGTSGIIFASSKDYKPSICKGLHSFAHSDGNYHLMGCTLACASSVDFWLKSILGKDDYATELQACQTIGINSVLFLPYISGERSPINDPNVRGMFYGLQVSHTRADMTVAVIEGICFALKDCLNEFNKAGIHPKISTLIGGLSQSKWVCQLLANILDVEIHTLETNQGGAFGAVILAMVGDSVYPDVSSACQSLSQAISSKFMPDKTLNNLYKRKFEEYKLLYTRLKV